MTAVIPPPGAYEEWWRKSNIFQDRFNDIMKELESVEFTPDNLDTELRKLQQAHGKIKPLDRDFAAWWTEVENFSFHFWDKIPPTVGNIAETLHYDLFLMLRTANLKNQLVQIGSGFNLKYSEYQWWKAYNKSVESLRVSQKGLGVARLGLWIAVGGTLIAIIGTAIAIFGSSPQ